MSSNENCDISGKLSAAQQRFTAKIKTEEKCDIP